MDERIERALARIGEDLRASACGVAEWLTGGEGLEFIHQESVQDFLWRMSGS